jgi:hypothetical protein
MKVVLVIALLFGGIFVVATGVSVVQFLKEHAFLSKAELDTGTITDSQVDSNGLLTLLQAPG